MPQGDDDSGKVPWADGEIPAGAPDIEAACAAFRDFLVTVAALRDPAGGCPWDLKQTHETLRRYMIEEAYEAADAMAAGDPAQVQDELGDVLLQVVLNAQVARDDGQFQVADVIRSIDAKMRRRHPHVFGGAAVCGQVKTAGDVRRAWDVIKAEEKAAAGGEVESGLFADAEKRSPATLQALKIGKIAGKLRFDWDSVDEVFVQLVSEVDELRAELAAAPRDEAKTAAEIGDVYFSLAQLCRHLGLDPEIVACDGNRKFLRRFAQLERLAATRGVALPTASRDQLEGLWQDVKLQE